MEYPASPEASAADLAAAIVAVGGSETSLPVPPVHVFETEFALFVMVPKPSRVSSKQARVLPGGASTTGRSTTLETAGLACLPLAERLVDELRHNEASGRHTFSSITPAVRMLERVHRMQLYQNDTTTQVRQANTRSTHSAPWASRLLGAAAFSSATLEGDVPPALAAASQTPKGGGGLSGLADFSAQPFSCGAAAASAPAAGHFGAPFNGNANHVTTSGAAPSRKRDYGEVFEPTMSVFEPTMSKLESMEAHLASVEEAFLIAAAGSAIGGNFPWF